ncbi:hypothetical protein pneo_cds_394 [Pandoravirus neocaledonia]|uniref:Uncharacterized protein n=1 Tax=Pandoravirus neocaledonia TaxID=2107708 RepID=A0A2U7UC12_9VIRU|nr:hypothetical protein pneo_cds_394 [Pandoravirus neocaledonia]AVK76001.1 hypothetical protein pneo_cds_394 [Pandoravirus neocaledonia]
MSTAADKYRAHLARDEPYAMTADATSRTCFLQSLDNPLYDERVYNSGSNRLRAIEAASSCDPQHSPLPYLVDDDGLPCLELLLSDAFAAPGCFAAASARSPASPTTTTIRGSKKKKKAATALSKKRKDGMTLPKKRKGATKRRATSFKSDRATKSARREDGARAAAKKQKRPVRCVEARTSNRDKDDDTRNNNDNSADNSTNRDASLFAGAAMEPAAAYTWAPPPPRDHTEDGQRNASAYAAMLARPMLARVLPRAAMTLPVTWYQPPCPSSSQHSPPPVRLYRRSAAAAALASLCHAMRINVAVDAPLDRAIGAVLSIPHALADSRRPHDPEAVTRVGWVALMGNHDRSSLAKDITPLWAGRAASLTSSGLDIVAPTHTTDDVTPEQRALRVLSSEAHMPWFAARVRAVAHETLMGTPSLLGCGLFDVLPVDTFLVLDLDVHGAARPYDIYVVPRVDLLTSRLAPG